MVTEKYKKEGIDMDDPELDPFREDLTTMKQIMATMTKRTQEAAQNGDSYSPAHLLLIDDLMAGNSSASRYRYNDDILRLFSAGRHAGAIIILMTQSYKMLSRPARLQATHLGLWQVQETQKKEIFEELAGRQGMTLEQLNSAFQTATARPHAGRSCPNHPSSPLSRPWGRMLKSPTR